MAEEAEFRWEQVQDPTTLAPGDHVRAMRFPPEQGLVWGEGVVSEVTTVDRFGDRYVRVVRGDGSTTGCDIRRPYLRKVTAETPAPEHVWSPIEGDLLREGMYVRGVGKEGSGAVTVEGRVTSLRDDNEVRVSDNGYVYIDRRTWEHRREAAPMPEVVLSRPQVGDRFTRRFNHPGFADRAGCVVVSVRDAGEAPGQTLWLLTYNDANGRYWDSELLVRPDGTCNPYAPSAREMRDTTGMYVPEVAVQSSPTGWVPVTDVATLTAGDVVRATPHAIGGRLQARVRYTYPDSFTGVTTHVIEETSNGHRTDLEGWPSRTGYDYRISTANAEVWRGVMPPPAPDAEPLTTEAQLAACVVPAAPLPAWATSLEAAHRHVHAVARRLYVQRQNCYDGSTDFVEALGLPPIEEDWPAPVPVDETAQIMVFLAKVREVAFGVADDHGKDSDLIEEWLTGEGIVKPKPAMRQHTVTFNAPADADLASVFTRLGWEVR